MIVCPVCEHQQLQGAECEVCGKRLVEGPAGIPVVAPVEGLEPTLTAPVDVAVGRLPEVEPTGHDAVGLVATDLTPDIEPTLAAPVDVDAVAVPDVERHAAEAVDLPTVLPAFTTCRYCRTPAAPGERICSRCGMRLPVVAETPGTTGAPPPRRICSCGTPITGSLCPSCGARTGGELP